MTQVVKSSGSPTPAPTPAHTIKVKPYEIAVYKTEDSFKSIFIHISFKYVQERLSHCHFSGSVHLQSEPFTLYLIENKRKELSRCFTSVWQKVDPTLTSVSEINPPQVTVNRTMKMSLLPTCLYVTEGIYYRAPESTHTHSSSDKIIPNVSEWLFRILMLKRLD